MDVHHECNQPLCVNPEHLKLLTKKENVLLSSGLAAQNARKVICIRGHALSGDNVYINPKGARKCRACGAFREREKRRIAKLAENK